MHAVGQAISSGPLAAIGDTLTPVLAALRMVWVISRHYSDDEGMSLLLQRVAFAIAERCRDAIDLKVRLRKGAGDAQASLDPLHTLTACAVPSCHGTLCVLLRRSSNAALRAHSGGVLAVWLFSRSEHSWGSQNCCWHEHRTLIGGSLLATGIAPC